MQEPSMHNDYQRDYFSNRELPRMMVEAGPGTPYVVRHSEAVVRTAHLTESDLVLDVGCGPGKYTKLLVQRGFQVEGMDLTPALVEQLHAVLPDVPGFVGDAADPPLALHGRYDAIVGFMVLHHVADLVSTFQGIARMLKERGRICFLEPNPYYPGFAVQIALTPGMTFRGEGGIYRMQPSRVRAALTGAGFSGVAISHFGVFPPFVANRPAGARWERRLEALPGWRPAQAFQVISARLA